MSKLGLIFPKQTNTTEMVPRVSLDYQKQSRVPDTLKLKKLRY